MTGPLNTSSMSATRPAVIVSDEVMTALTGNFSSTLAQQRGEQRDARRPTFDRVGFERSHIVHDRVKIAGNEVETGDQQLSRAGNGFGHQLPGFGCREITTPQYDSTRARPKAEPTPLLFQRAQFVN